MSDAGVLPIEDRGYSQPEILVSIDWVSEHLNDPSVKVFEADEDVLLYDTGHVPGAQKIDWVDDLNDSLRRDYIGRREIESLLRSKGVNTDTTIVLYGDKNNWWAAYTLWVFRLFGIGSARLMDGGRALWIKEGRELSTDVPSYPAGNLSVGERNDGTVRVFRQEVEAHIGGQLVDVRSPEEYRGERMHMPDYPNEGALRGGHIPGAANVPWSRAVDPESHTFLTADQLRAIYEGEKGLDGSKPVITYCRIGERSSHTWFVLNYLLGYDDVKNYDGSWTEWGNLVGVPIEK